MASNSIVCFDANVWIAYFDKDDSLASRAEDLILETIQSHRVFIVTTFVIQEVLTVFLYKEKQKTADVFTRFISEHSLSQIIIHDFESIQASIVFAKKLHWRPKLSLTDWTLFYGAITSEYALYTFDKQLENALKRFPGVLD